MAHQAKSDDQRPNDAQSSGNSGSASGANNKTPPAAGKRRNFSAYFTMAAAKQHQRIVQFFKRY